MRWRLMKRRCAGCLTCPVDECVCETSGNFLDTWTVTDRTPVRSLLLREQPHCLHSNYYSNKISCLLLTLSLAIIVIIIDKNLFTIKIVVNRRFCIRKWTIRTVYVRSCVLFIFTATLFFLSFLLTSSLNYSLCVFWMNILNYFHIYGVQHSRNRIITTVSGQNATNSWICFFFSSNVVSVCCCITQWSSKLREEKKNRIKYYCKILFEIQKHQHTIYRNTHKSQTA